MKKGLFFSVGRLLMLAGCALAVLIPAAADARDIKVGIVTRNCRKASLVAMQAAGIDPRVLICRDTAGEKGGYCCRPSMTIRSGVSAFLNSMSTSLQAHNLKKVLAPRIPFA